MFVQIEGFPEYFIGEDGTVASVKGKKWKELKPGINKHGYLHLSLSNNGKKVTKNVHTLVAEAFLGPCPKGFVVDHICPRRGKTYNHYSNLEYVSQKENIHRAWDNGLCERVVNAKAGTKRQRLIPDSEIVQILELRGGGLTQKEIAAKFGISQSMVSYLWSGKKKKYLTRREKT